jgi:hypothetical protein
VVKSGQLEKREVQVGISGFVSTEIAHGLKLHDVIAMPSDKFELKDQMDIEIQE